MPIRCPTCKKSDSLVTLKALFADEAQLAQLPEERREQLALPPLPQPLNSRPVTIMMGTLFLLIFAFGLVILFFSYRRLGSGNNAVNGFCISALMVLGPLLFWPQYRSYLKQKVFEREQELLNWERIQQRWGLMQYCRRDDIVFDPSDGVPRDPEHFLKALKRSVRES